MFRTRTVCSLRHFLVVAALAALGACSDQQPTEPRRPTAARLDALLSSGPRLVECHSDESATASAPIGVLGGVVSIGGTSVTVPEGALGAETNVELTIPASRYVEIRLKADDQEHFSGFLKPVVVTIDYSRCNRSDLLTKPLSVWYIDSDTKELQERMGGVDNKLTQSITFTTPHFSGYAIAF